MIHFVVQCAHNKIHLEMSQNIFVWTTKKSQVLVEQLSPKVLD